MAIIQKKTPVLHYTSETMAKDLIGLVPFEKGDIVLDPCSGRNKVWYRNFPEYASNLECEIEDGSNFFEWSKPVDWCVGNPPFSQGFLFSEKAMSLCRKGIAYLGNHNFINSMFLPARMEKCKMLGFSLSNIHIVMDKRWYGRYYFLILRKDWKGDCKVGWIAKTYTDGPVPAEKPLLVSSDEDML